ncbi:uncharacterized protein LOC122648255 [Telopea speciosissima]|uniref:uncharacterized protein LOC122648255 n=1 Tax=Telopea speciosissima TaxID=54955 RepID=UPI001CC688C9|nr:uncharacterized protein LOC122648255 [Telopea speciosissima]
MAQGTLVIDHVMKIQNFFQDLENLGTSFKLNYKTAIIFYSLPQDIYGSFIVNFNMNKISVKLPELGNMLQEVEIASKKQKMEVLTTEEKPSSSRPKVKKISNDQLPSVPTEISADVPTEEQQPQEPRWSGRSVRPPTRLNLLTEEDQSVEEFHMVSDCSETDPYTYVEALKDVDSDKWKEAMRSEIDSMHSNHVWTLEALPQGVKTIGYKWIFKRKRENNKQHTTPKIYVVDPKMGSYIHGRAIERILLFSGNVTKPLLQPSQR